MLNVSTKDTTSFQKAIVGKCKKACSGRPAANTLIFQQGGEAFVLLNIEVKELNRAHRMAQRLVQVSEKMDTGIDTCIQPGLKLFRRAEEAFIKQASHGYRQVPLEPVDETGALEASLHDRQKSTITMKKKSRPD